MKVLLVVILVLFGSGLMILGNHGLALSVEGNLGQFSKLYVEWVDQVYNNSQVLTGHAIELDWLPG